ncbi:hypothetical protein [Croceibacterium aestuarii]|uniref:hypothetical protein n=1 Tax=Croceibacterium aestuarii TaxID=3064139 RepID=UPI00272EB3C6|nr:hypothetical protein [Croceibacterium sp. D39]
MPLGHAGLAGDPQEAGDRLRILGQHVEAVHEASGNDHCPAPGGGQIEQLETRAGARLHRQAEENRLFEQGLEGKRRIRQKAAREDEQLIITANGRGQIARAAKDLELGPRPLSPMAQGDRFGRGAVSETEDFLAALPESEFQLVERQRAAAENSGVAGRVEARVIGRNQGNSHMGSLGRAWRAAKLQRLVRPESSR